MAMTSGEDQLDSAIMRRAATKYRRRVVALFTADDAIPVGSGGAVRSTTVIRVSARTPFAEAWGHEFGQPRIVNR